jgi:hypothetical protein
MPKMSIEKAVIQKMWLARMHTAGITADVLTKMGQGEPRRIRQLIDACFESSTDREAARLVAKNYRRQVDGRLYAYNNAAKKKLQFAELEKRLADTQLELNTCKVQIAKLVIAIKFKHLSV